MTALNATSSAAIAAPATSSQGGTGVAPPRDSSAGLRPALCPRCDYSQLGLPDIHRCPECGLHFDDHSRIWEETSPWTPGKTFALVIHAGFALAAAGALLWCYWARGGCTERAFLFLAGNLAVWPVMFVCQWMWNHRRQFVAVCPDGVLIRTTNWHTRVIPWSRVRHVALGPGAIPLFAVISLRGRNRYALRPALTSSHAVREFAAAVERGKKRHAS